MPDTLWFLDNHVTIHTAADDRGFALLEMRGPQGDEPPLHLHRTEDEVFTILEGRVSFAVGAETVVAKAGETVVAPRNVPHRYRVESDEGARWLVLVAPGDFEGFVRETSRPAGADDLPPRGGPPSPEQARELTEIAARYGIEILAP